MEVDDSPWGLGHHEVVKLFLFYTLVAVEGSQVPGGIPTSDGRSATHGTDTVEDIGRRAETQATASVESGYGLELEEVEDSRGRQGRSLQRVGEEPIYFM